MEFQPLNQQQPSGLQAPSGQKVGSGEGKESLANGKVTQDQFLKLLITQLQHQDPLKPLENQDFVAQLATFNSLDQLIGINDKLDTMKAEQLTLSRLEATSFLGKEVNAKGNTVSLGAGESAELHYALAAEATRVVVNLKDSDGNLVRTLNVGGQKAGEQAVSWDGKDDAGDALNAGVYTFEVEAFDVQGKTVAVTNQVRGVVTGVDMEGEEPLLTIGQLKVPLSAVTRVQEAG